MASTAAIEDHSEVIVSVVICVFNDEANVSVAIESALSQTLREIEVVVVDDGSTDNTPDVLDGYRKRVRVLSQVNRGPAAARNTGIRVSRGKYVCFLDSDDLFLPHKCEMQAKYLDENPEVSLCYAPARLVSAHAPERISRLSLNLPQDFAFRCPFPINCPMIRRVSLDQVGCFDESLRCSEDRDLWARLYLAGCNFAVSGEEIVAEVKLREQSLSRDPTETLRGNMLMLDKYFSLIGDGAPVWLEAAARSAAYVVAGADYLRLGELDNASNAFSRAISVDDYAFVRSRNWGLILRHLDSCFPDIDPEGLRDYKEVWNTMVSILRAISSRRRLRRSEFSMQLSAFAYSLSGLAFSRGKSWQARRWLARAIFLRPSLLMDFSQSLSILKRIIGSPSIVKILRSAISIGWRKKK